MFQLGGSMFSLDPISRIFYAVVSIFVIALTAISINLHNRMTGNFCKDRKVAWSGSPIINSNYYFCVVMIVIASLILMWRLWESEHKIQWLLIFILFSSSAIGIIYYYKMKDDETQCSTSGIAIGEKNNSFMFIMSIILLSLACLVTLFIILSFIYAP